MTVKRDKESFPILMPCSIRASTCICSLKWALDFYLSSHLVMGVRAGEEYEELLMPSATPLLGGMRSRTLVYDVIIASLTNNCSKLSYICELKEKVKVLATSNMINVKANFTFNSRLIAEGNLKRTEGRK